MFVCEVKTSPPQEFKVDLDSGTFEGYCAAYGNVDSGNDRILFGAGADIAKANPVLPIYFGHGWMQNERPIGKSLYFEERLPGLFTKGKMFDTPAGAEVLTGMREGVLGVMSIGYKATEKKTVTEGGKRIREISKFELGEYSILPNGMSMNDRAVVTNVKGRLMFADTKARYVSGVTGLTDVGGTPSWEAIEDAVEQALRAIYPAGAQLDIRDMSESAAVYEVGDWEAGTEDLFQIGYSVDADGSATLVGDPLPVDIHVSYVPAAEALSKSRVDLTDAHVPAKDYRALRGFVEEADPIGLLLDEATYLNELARDLKAEGREDEVQKALAELDAAALLLKGHCAVKDIPVADGDLLALIRRTTANIHEASRTLAT